MIMKYSKYKVSLIGIHIIKLFFLIIALFIISVNVCISEAAVKTKLKGTTYVVSGKGKMTDKNIPTKKQKKKIRKVIIKKGVTSIAKYAFYDCKKLVDVSISDSVKNIDSFAFYNTSIRHLTIPNTVKNIGCSIVGGMSCPQIIDMPGKVGYIWPDDDECYSAKIVGSTDNIGSVTVNITSQLDLKTVCYLPVDYINVMSGDKNYSSHDGLIYTKDLKKLIRVPGGRENVIVRDGCEVVDLEAFNYKTPAVEDYVTVVASVNNVVIPQSVKTIINSGEDEEFNEYGNMSDAEWTINTKNLDDTSFRLIYKNYKYSKGVLKGLADSGYIILNNDFLLLNDKELPDVNGYFAYKYIGDAKNITIPNGVTEISSYLCFEKNTVESISLPDSVRIIGDQAFYDYEQLKSIRLNEGLEKIGVQAFASTGFTSLKLPESLKEIGTSFIGYTNIRELTVPKNVIKFEGAFCDSRLYKITFDNSFEKLPGSVFSYCQNLYDVKLPETVKVIGDNAFENCYNIDIQKVLDSLPNLEKIEKRAFYEVPFKDIVIPEHVKYVGEYAFSISGSYKKVINPKVKSNLNYNKASKTIKINNKNIKLAKYAFNVYKNTTLVYADKFKNTYTSISDNYNEKHIKSKKTFLYRFLWTKVKGASGYQVKICYDKQINKGLYNENVKGNSIKVTFHEDNNNYYRYVMVRPYKESQGKKIYGKWSEKRKVYIY